MKAKSFALISVLVVLGAAVVQFNALGRLQADQSPYEIVIVARDMKFVLPDQNPQGQANPLMTLPIGVPIAIIFRNDDLGMKHDLILQGLDVRSRLLSYGEVERLTFTVQQSIDGKTYFCSLHPQTMRGRLAIH